MKNQAAARLRGGLFFDFWFFIMARPIFTQRQTHCSRRKTNYAGPALLFAVQPIKVFCRGFFQKSRKVFFKRAGAKSASSRTASVTDFAWGRRLRLNGCLAACGPRFYEGCGPGSGLRPRKKARPTGGHSQVQKVDYGQPERQQRGSEILSGPLVLLSF